jgi:hypothetical protein
MSTNYEVQEEKLVVTETVEEVKQYTVEQCQAEIDYIDVQLADLTSKKANYQALIAKYNELKE